MVILALAKQNAEMAHQRCCRSFGENLFYSITRRRNLTSNCFSHRFLVGFCRFKSKDSVNECNWFKLAVVSSTCQVGNAKNGVYRFKNTLSSSNETSTPTVKGIENFLKQKEIKFNHGHTTIVAECPFCAVGSARKERENYSNELLTLFVNKTTGSHVCNSCGTSGTWKQLKVLEC